MITSILQNILFYVQHKKETHAGLEQYSKYIIMKYTIPLIRICVIEIYIFGHNIYIYIYSISFYIIKKTHTFDPLSIAYLFSNC